MNDTGCGWRDQKPRLGGVLLYWSTAKAKPKSDPGEGAEIRLLAVLQSTPPKPGRIGAPLLPRITRCPPLSPS